MAARRDGLIDDGRGVHSALWRRVVCIVFVKERHQIQNMTVVYCNKPLNGEGCGNRGFNFRT